jgi:hypothetical protein
VSRKHDKELASSRNHAQAAKSASSLIQAFDIFSCDLF